VSSTILISNSVDAAKLITEELHESGIEVERQFTHHTKQGAHVNLIDKKSGQVHHVKFSKEPFYAFGRIFDYGDMQGDSLDEKVVDSLKDDDRLYFAYPTKIYTCSLKDFTSWNLWRDTKHGTKTCSYALTCVNLVGFSGVN